MKVILLKHIKGKGRAGDVIEVPDGYAHNALLPQKLAKIATKSELNKIDLAKKSTQIKAAKEQSIAVSVIESIHGKGIVITEKINEKGSLYHALGLKEIIKAVKDQLNLVTPKEFYLEKYALKDSGEYTLKLEAYGKKADLSLSIQAK